MDALRDGLIAAVLADTARAMRCCGRCNDLRSTSAGSVAKCGTAWGSVGAALGIWAVRCRGRGARGWQLLTHASLCRLPHLASEQEGESSVISGRLPAITCLLALQRLNDWLPPARATSGWQRAAGAVPLAERAPRSGRKLLSSFQRV